MYAFTSPGNGARTAVIEAVMPLYRITDPATGRVFGLFSADSKNDALDMLARAHGCADYRRSLFCTPTMQRQVEVTLINGDPSPPPRQDTRGVAATLARIFRESV
jgi:hypothetical protein